MSVVLFNPLIIPGSRRDGQSEMGLDQGRDALLDGRIWVVEPSLVDECANGPLHRHGLIQALCHRMDESIVGDGGGLRVAEVGHVVITPADGLGVTSDTMPRPPPWTDEDILALEALSQRSKRNRLNWRALLKRFPNRTRMSISVKLTRMGLTKSRRWTPQEDKILKAEWGEVCSRTLGKLLPGRTQQSRYDRAQKLGLSAGAPQGMVSIKSLSKNPKWGYNYYTTLRILKAAGVPVKSRNYGSAKVESRGVRYVDYHDAVEAAGTWERNRSKVETVSQAASRIGMASHTLWQWLTLEGLVPPKAGGSGGGMGRRYEALPEVYDRVNKKYRKRRLHPTPEPVTQKPDARCGKENLKVAAVRLHVRTETLREWLTLEGILPPVKKGVRCHFYDLPEVFDRVAAKYRTGRNAPKGARHPVEEESPAERSSTRMDGALPATITPPPA